MVITVFGPGCSKCAETEKLIKGAVASSGKNITVQKVSDLKEMMAAGVLSTPAVVIGGVVKSSGKVPSKQEIAAWIDGAVVSAPSDAPHGGCCCNGKC